MVGRFGNVEAAAEKLEPARFDCARQPVPRRTMGQSRASGPASDCPLVARNTYPWIRLRHCFDANGDATRARRAACSDSR